ncbi:hypothetical protein [Sinorhizobium meliloti]
MFRRRDSSSEGVSNASPKSARKAFEQSITVEALNPKTAIVFMRFFRSSLTAIRVFHSGRSSLYSEWSFAGFIVKKLKGSSAAQRLVQRACGTILVGLGLHVALQRT